ncbi:MAG TPA: hypothetical protein VK524_05295 [Polyangiaceae bacterium]|nr:hypothetical protein [Polyangiaceae bacterium]
MSSVLVASASPPRRVGRPWSAPDYSLTLQGDAGQSLRTFRHLGKTIVLGEPGDRYTIRIHNPTARRVEAVVSVDGRDAISGSMADFTRDRGYVIPAFGSVTVDGFRTSLDSVAAFRFTDAQHSYSARMGTAENVGVIGLAIFPERQLEKAKVARRGRAAPASRSAPAPAGAADANRLGTEFGEARLSSVTEVPFTRANRTRPARVISVFYDDASGLRARGIEVFEPSWRPAAVEPQPFPRSRFAAPPPDDF